MNTLKTSWLKISAAVIVSVIVDIALHILWAPRIDYAPFPASIVVEKGLYPLFATLAILAVFGALAVVFVLIQADLTGTRIAKGLRYGISFCLLWFIGILEMSLLFKSSLAEELRTSAVDGGAILLLGLLLGAMMAGNSNAAAPGKSKAGALSILVIAAIYLVGRYFGYGVVNIMSAYAAQPLATLAWTIGVGLSVGLMYFLLKDGLRGSSPLARALWFGVVVFGTDWLIFNQFVLVFVKTSALDLLIRASIDILFVTLGVWAVEVWSRRACSPKRDPHSAVRSGRGGGQL